MALTPKQQKFVDEYLVDLNATQAAIRSEYSQKTAYSMGQRLLKNVEIQLAIQARQRELRDKTQITQERILSELAKIGFSSITDYLEYKTLLRKTGSDRDGNDEYDWAPTIIAKESSEVDGAAIQEVSVGKDGTFKLKLYNKLDALENLGKHLGMFDKGAGVQTATETNLPDAIAQSTEGDVDTDDLPEVE